MNRLIRLLYSNGVSMEIEPAEHLIEPAIKYTFKKGDQTMPVLYSIRQITYSSISLENHLVRNLSLFLACVVKGGRGEK